MLRRDWLYGKSVWCSAFALFEWSNLIWDAKGGCICFIKWRLFYCILLVTATALNAYLLCLAFHSLLFFRWRMLLRGCRMKKTAYLFVRWRVSCPRFPACFLVILHLVCVRCSSTLALEKQNSAGASTPQQAQRPVQWILSQNSEFWASWCPGVLRAWSLSKLSDQQSSV